MLKLLTIDVYCILQWQVSTVPWFLNGSLMLYLQFSRKIYSKVILMQLRVFLT